jgi:hypothetical protein
MLSVRFVREGNMRQLARQANPAGFTAWPQQGQQKYQRN